MTILTSSSAARTGAGGMLAERQDAGSERQRKHERQIEHVHSPRVFDEFLTAALREALRPRGG